MEDNHKKINLQLSLLDISVILAKGVVRYENIEGLDIIINLEEVINVTNN